MRQLDVEAIEDVAIGSAILGAGGGGDPYIGKLLAVESVLAHGPVPVVQATELDDDDRVVFVAGIGAPGVLVEKLPRVEEAVRALEALEGRLGRAFTHLCPAEAGGLNALTPIGPAAATGRPILDSDGMGRAFPSLDLVTPTLHGGVSSPIGFADEHGNTMIIDTETNAWAEELVRAATVASGGIAMIAVYPMTGRQARDWLVHGALSMAQRLGEAVRSGAEAGTAPIERVLAETGGRVLFEGTVISVERRNERGWTLGTALIRGGGAHSGSTLRLEFQNEHLIALVDEAVVATVPDLIMVLGQDSAEPIPAEEIRFGQRTAVVGLPCDPQWRTEAGLVLAGPRRFGYDYDFRPVEGSHR